jgi:hypothetical protein
MEQLRMPSTWNYAYPRAEDASLRRQQRDITSGVWTSAAPYQSF